MAKINKENAYLLINKEYKDFTKDSMNNIVDALVEINFFKYAYKNENLNKYSNKDIYIISEIYKKSLELNDTKELSYEDIAQIVIESEYPSFNEKLRQRLVNYQKRVDEERLYEKNNKSKGFKSFINPFSTKVAGESYLMVKIIKIVFMIVLVFSLSATLYITIMSTTDVGIQHKFEEVSKKNKDNYKNFSTSGNFNVGKETHSVFTYTDNDGLLAVDLNLSKSEIVTKEIVSDDSTIKNPLIIIQLYNILFDKDDSFKIKEMSYKNDSIIINDKSYKLEIENTQIKSINGDDVNKYNNVLFTQIGQLNLLEEYSIDTSDIKIENISFDKENKESVIDFITDGKNKYSLITYSNQKVVINQVPINTGG